MVREARRARVLLVLGAGPAGDRDQHGARVAGVGAEPAREFLAIHAGQADVEQAHVRFEG